MTSEELLRSVPEVAPLDAELLLARTLDRDRTWVLAHPGSVVPQPAARRFRRQAARRATGIPLAYLTGEKEFFGRPFTVTRDVLCPRPDSELLVERALAWLRPGDTLVEVGTGSGCIGLSLRLERPGVTAVLTDISPAALAVARVNGHRHAVPDVRFRLADGWPKDLGRAPGETVVVANLPYLTPVEADALPDEPRIALAGGHDGLHLIRRLVAGLERTACRPRRVLLEHGPDQAARIRDIVPRPARTHRDLAGRERVTEY